MLYLSGIPVRAGYDRKWGFLLTKRIPHTKQFGLRHEIDYALEAARYLGAEPSGRGMHMAVQAEAARKAADMLAETGVGGGDLLIAVNPGASCPSKRWPAEKFAKAASELADKYNAKVAVVCAGADRISGDKVAGLIGPRCANLSGRTTVAELAAVLKRAKLFISNDSGPVHIACAVGTPVVAVFGRNDAGLSPRRWGPSGARDRALHKDAGCAVCLAHRCGIGFKCLEMISAAEVVAASEEILGVPGGSRGYKQ
jgi:ADP-heptose:LPS heptosyltransferase